MTPRRRGKSAIRIGAVAAGLLVLAALIAWPTKPRTGSGARDVRRGASLSEQGPVAVGHRGMAGCAPNTIPCYQQAIARGAGALEVDVRITAEGIPVAFHDAETSLQAGKKRRVRELRLSELRGLDAGWGYSADGGRTHPLRGQGLRVPTLREVVRAIPDVPMLIDIKDGGARTARALERFIESELRPGDLPRLFFKANDKTVEDRLMRAQPHARLALGAGRRLTLYLGLWIGLADALVPDLPPTWIDVCHAVPRYRDTLKKVGSWSGDRPHIVTVSTINDPKAAAELLETPGLDGIVTDRPDLLADVLDDWGGPRQVRHPHPSP